MPTWLLIVFAVIAAVGTLAGLWFLLSDRFARPSLRLDLEAIRRREDETGALIVFGTVSSTIVYALHIANEGRKAGGRAAVSVWAPRSTSLQWAADATGAESSGAPSAAWSQVTLTDAVGAEHPSIELPRSLDAVPMIGLTLYLRVATPMRYGDRESFPLRVRVRRRRQRRRAARLSDPFGAPARVEETAARAPVARAISS